MQEIKEKWCDAGQKKTTGDLAAKRRYSFDAHHKLRRRASLCSCSFVAE